MFPDNESIEVIRSVDGEVLQSFIERKAMANAKLYSDENRAYAGLPREIVRHSVLTLFLQKASLFYGMTPTGVHTIFLYKHA